MCVCVCVFLGSMYLTLLLRDNFESLKCCLDLQLRCMLDCIHICVFPFLKTDFKPPRHQAICRALTLFHIAISTLPQQLGGLIENVPGSSIASRQLVDRSSFFQPLLMCPSTDSQQLHLLTFFFSTPLDTSICRDLLNLYIKVPCDLAFIFSRFLS